MTDDPGEAPPQPPEGPPPVSTRVRVAFVLAVIVFGLLPAVVMWQLLSEGGGLDAFLSDIGKQLSAIGNRL